MVVLLNMSSLSLTFQECFRIAEEKTEGLIPLGLIRAMHTAVKQLRRLCKGLMKTLPPAPGQQQDKRSPKSICACTKQGILFQDYDPVIEQLKAVKVDF